MSDSMSSSKTKVLVSGIAGFTGKHFCDFIEQEGLEEKYDFLGVDLPGHAQIDMRYRSLDCTSETGLCELLSEYEPDYILNLIGRYGTNDFDSLLKCNSTVSRNICEAIRQTGVGVRNTVLIGSAAEYGDSRQLPICEQTELHPVNAYGLTKKIQYHYMEYYAREHKLPITLARTFNLIGSGIPACLCVGSFMEQISHLQCGDTITVGNLNSKRDFLDIRDAVRAYWMLLTATPGVYNVCKGDSVTIQSLLEAMIEYSGKQVQIEVDPQRFKPHEIPDSYGSNQKLQEHTGWHPTFDPVEAIRNMFA